MSESMKDHASARGNGTVMVGAAAVTAKARAEISDLVHGSKETLWSKSWRWDFQTCQGVVAIVASRQT
jgi:hypothetical protein